MRLYLYCLIALLGLSCTATKNPRFSTDQALEQKLRLVLDSAVIQYAFIKENLDSTLLPRTFEQGSLKTTRPDGWVSGFYPGTLFYLYEFSRDKQVLTEALRSMRLLEQEQFNKRTHDLGFMMYCSYGNANRLDPRPQYDSVLINAARSLSSRFSPTVGCIRSWDSEPSKFVVIIDNMMNLELLMYAFRQTGDSAFYHIAVTHANTTLKHHFRPDNSSWHVVNYDPQNGAVLSKITHQGAGDHTAWARGQAWGMYGYTMMYRETGIRAYLDQAIKIADFILAHPAMPDDMVPYWDFDAPGIPEAYRDASAAAIMSSSLLELAYYTEGDKGRSYFNAAEKMLSSLSAAPYKSSGDEVGGFLLKHGVGHLPADSEIDVPLSYGDYYYVEAALRYLGIQAIPIVN